LASPTLRSGNVTKSDDFLKSSTAGTLGEMEMLSGKHKKERRSGLDRRQFSYDLYIPERRSGSDRRVRDDRNDNLSAETNRDGSIDSFIDEGDTLEAVA